MSAIHLHQTSTATPEQHLAGLTDFGLAARCSLAEAPTITLRCIAADPRKLMSTKGSGGIWERLHYDWSEPGERVRPNLRFHASPGRLTASTWPSYATAEYSKNSNFDL